MAKRKVKQVPRILADHDEAKNVFDESLLNKLTELGKFAERVVRSNTHGSMIRAMECSYDVETTVKILAENYLGARVLVVSSKSGGNSINLLRDFDEPDDAVEFYSNL